MTETGPDAEGSTREQELLRENAALRARVEELEARLATVPSPQPPPPPIGIMAPRSAPPTSPPDARTTAPAPSDTLTAEQFIGRRVVPFVGAIAVLGAVGYLVNYAIEIGLIGRVPPEARFALGVVIGLGLLALGEFVRRRGAPGAAEGLDSAGVGAVMVSVALGVFTLNIFSPSSGAWIAAAAGILAAAWSLRSGSVAVAIVALIGVYAMPAGVGLARDEPRSAGILLALALAIGLATHLFGGTRFAPARFLALAAAIVLGAPVLYSLQAGQEAFFFALAWWFLVIGECVLAAQRGIDARGNAIVALMASAGLVLVEIGTWPSGLIGGIAVELLPSVAGGVLLGGALLLRPMAFDPKDDEERASLGQEGIAIGTACGMLSRTFAALALALGIGGFVFLVGSGLHAFILVGTAAAACWIGRRYALLSFDLVAVMFGFIGTFLGIFHAIEAAATKTSFALPWAPTIDLSVQWSAEIAALGVAVGILFAMGSLLRLPWSAGLLVPAMAIGWCVFSVRLLPGMFGCALLVVPAIVTAWIPRARIATVVGALLPCVLAGAWWFGRSMDVAWGPGRSGTVELIAVVVPWIAAVLLLSRHRAIGRAREVTARLAVVASGGAVAFVAAVMGSHAGFDGLDAGFAVVIGLAIASSIVTVVARLSREDALLDSGLLLAGGMIATCGILGLARLFTRDAVEQAPLLEFAALGSSLAALAIGVAMSRSLGLAATRRDALAAAIAFAIAPFLVLLLSAIMGSPLEPAAAVGCLVLVGVAELVLGFRCNLAALRWAGLSCFGVLVLRLYAVDLADAPMLVRIGLLFVSGMVLVGTGIAYARITKAPA